MTKVCFFTPYEIIDEGELGSSHIQLTTEYELTDKPGEPGYVCEVTEHRVIMSDNGEVSDWSDTYKGELKTQ